MNSLFAWFKGKTMMALCIAACVVPFLALMLFGGGDKLYLFGLLACVGMHLMMMKMMPGHTACHGADEHNHKGKQTAKALPSPARNTLDA
ncbi:hypothetical protein [Gynuella sunshinyii]|uniref:DUF2933 domain-containing protein n=1 Tax=Gynuella sunshinyii YC6258 TaxID=1445510 RepID=A0A0C5VVW3_9GAMM|nr:hypothetical protein [Gynuella sunshinyii]AJQ97458.1 hypothetical Protein YC6258_05428 [Gynuella sunshinyii YC6258]